ncbi:hypothetical protein CR513_02050, partial [Mucuna pruriens]
MPFTVFIVVSNHQGIVSEINIPRSGAVSVAPLLPPPHTFQYSPPEVTSFVSPIHNASMDNNNSRFVSNDEDPFDSQLIDNFVEVDPALVLPNPNAVPQQQNHRFGLLQGNIPFPNSVIQDQSMQGNNNFTFGGGVGNIDVGGPKRKHPFADPMIEDQVMHDNNNVPNGGGVGNVESDSPFQMQPPKQNMGPPRNCQNMIALPYWPQIPRPFFCSCCQVLRQIIHTDGFIFEKLEIHGTIGVISHAIIQNRSITPDGPPTDAHQMIDFSYKTPEQIRSFLISYCKQQIKLGCVIVKDPLSAYYETICARLDWAEEIGDEDDDSIPQSDMDEDTEPETEPENGTSKRRNMGIQRRRVQNMTLNDLSGVFHITMNAASKILDLSVTSIKKICRRGDLDRWPQSEVNTLAKQVAVLRRALDSPDPGTRERTRQEIQRLQEEIIAKCMGITPTGIEMLQF